MIGRRAFLRSLLAAPALAYAAPLASLLAPPAPVFTPKAFSGTVTFSAADLIAAKMREGMAAMRREVDRQMFAGGAGPRRLTSAPMPYYRPACQSPAPFLLPAPPMPRTWCWNSG